MSKEHLINIGNNFLNGNKPKDCLILNFLSWVWLQKMRVNVKFPIYVSPTSKVSVGKNVEVGRYCVLKGNIKLADNVKIGENSLLGDNISIGKYSCLVKSVELIGTIKIGKYCAIARNVTFQGTNHFMHKAGIQIRFYREMVGEKLESVKKGSIIVGNDVWIGTKAIILSGVKIGDGAVIGAGAVVTKDVEPYSIVGGMPAKHLKWRFPEHIRNQLLEIKWWDWDKEKIKRNKEFFTTDLTEVKNLHDIIKP